jgi:hypothetical protein
MKIDADTPFTVEGLRVFVRGDNQPGTLGASIAELFARLEAAERLLKLWQQGYEAGMFPASSDLHASTRDHFAARAQEKR